MTDENCVENSHIQEILVCSGVWKARMFHCESLEQLIGIFDAVSHMEKKLKEEVGPSAASHIWAGLKNEIPTFGGSKPVGLCEKLDVWSWDRKRALINLGIRYEIVNRDDEEGDELNQSILDSLEAIDKLLVQLIMDFDPFQSNSIKSPFNTARTRRQAEKIRLNVLDVCKKVKRTLQ